MAVAFHSESIEIQEEDDYDDFDNQTPEDDVKYENVETKRKHPQKMSVRTRYRLVVLGFGLLCGVQALLNIGLRLSHYSALITEKNNMAKDLEQITAERDELGRRLCEPHGFTFGGGVCYHISTLVATWEQSRQNCRATQSDLMVINSKEKQDFVNSLHLDAWLGLTDREEEGVWKWIDGTQLTAPTDWRPGEPNNEEAAEDCAVHHHKGGWNDESCSKTFRWLCERVDK